MATALFRFATPGRPATHDPCIHTVPAWYVYQRRVVGASLPPIPGHTPVLAAVPGRVVQGVIHLRHPERIEGAARRARGGATGVAPDLAGGGRKNRCLPYW